MCAYNKKKHCFDVGLGGQVFNVLSIFCVKLHSATSDLGLPLYFYELPVVTWHFLSSAWPVMSEMIESILFLTNCDCVK